MRSKSAAVPGVFKHRTMTRLVKAQGLTNRSLAERVGANQSTVRRWANGDVVPSPKFIWRLADALGAATSELYQVTETGRDLAYYRVLAGYSLAQLAGKIGICSMHLGRMEAGHSPIPDYHHEPLRELLALDEETMERAVRRSQSRRTPAPRQRPQKPVIFEFIDADSEPIGA